MAVWSQLPLMPCVPNFTFSISSFLSKLGPFPSSEFIQHSLSLTSLRENHDFFHNVIIFSIYSLL